MERATKRNQKPRLRKAMFKMFAPQFIVEGFECFAFILIKQVFLVFSFQSEIIFLWLFFYTFRSRSLLPLVLAQLLIQFQKPIDVPKPISNATNDLITDPFGAQLNNVSRFDREIRSISFDEEPMNDDSFGRRIKERFVAPDYANGSNLFLLKVFTLN